MAEYIIAAAVIFTLLNEPSMSSSRQITFDKKNSSHRDKPEPKTGSRRLRTKSENSRGENEDAAAKIQSQNNKRCDLDCSAIPGSSCDDGTCTDPYYTMTF